MGVRKASQPQGGALLLGNELLLAAIEGDVGRVDALCAAGAPIETTTDTGATPLMLAAAHGVIASVNILLEHGANVYRQDRTGSTALLLAAYKGHAEVVQVLLCAVTPLPLAPAGGPGEGRPYTLEEVADWRALSQQTAKGETALHAAAKGGHRRVVELLLACGAEVETGCKPSPPPPPTPSVVSSEPVPSPRLHGADSVSSVTQASSGVGHAVDDVLHALFACVGERTTDTPSQVDLERAVNQVLELLLMDADESSSGSSSQVAVEDILQQLLATAERSEPRSAAQIEEVLEALLAGAESSTHPASSQVASTISEVRDTVSAALSERSSNIERTISAMLEGMVAGAAASTTARAGTSSVTSKVNRAVENMLDVVEFMGTTEQTEVEAAMSLASIGTTTQVEEALDSLLLAAEMSSRQAESAALLPNDATPARESTSESAESRSVASLIFPGDMVEVCTEALPTPVYVECNSTPLQLAAARGHQSVVEVLLTHGADFNASHRVDGRTALMRAAAAGSLPVVNAILDAEAGKGGSLLETADARGLTAFAHAAVHGHLEVCQVLWLAGVRMEVRCASGNTPLALACQHGCTPAAVWLLERQADPLVRNRQGETPLWLAVAHGHMCIGTDAVGTADVILQRCPFHGDAGVPMVEVRDRDGWTLLGWAAREGNVAAIRWLLDKGADILSEQPNALLPRTVADRCGHWEAAELLGAQARTRWAVCQKCGTKGYLHHLPHGTQCPGCAPLNCTTYSTAHKPFK